MNRFLLVLIVAALAAGGWYWTHRAPPAAPPIAEAGPATTPPPPAPAQPSAAVAVAPPAVAPVPAPGVPASPPARKLTLADIAQPPLDAPVKDVLKQLADAANQGVPQAACRLGFELIRCARVRNGLLALDNAQKAAAAAPKDSPQATPLARNASLLAQTLARDRQACGDVADADTSDAWRYVYIAAANGSLPAMMRFVRDPGMAGPPGTPGFEEAWAAYQRDAPQFLGDAIRGGDVRALYQGYVSALTGNSAGGAGVFARNPEKAIAYAVALRGLRDRQTEQEIEQAVQGLIDQVGPARADAARQQGEQMRAEFFANAPQLDRAAADRAPDAGECWK